MDRTVSILIFHCLFYGSFYIVFKHCSYLFFSSISTFKRYMFLYPTHNFVLDEKRYRKRYYYYCDHRHFRHSIYFVVLLYFVSACIDDTIETSHILNVLSDTQNFFCLNINLSTIQPLSIVGALSMI